MDIWQFHVLEDRHHLDFVEVAGMPLRPGDRVKLRPRAGGDIFDIALAGQIATIEAIEQDYDGRIHLAVVVDADPGREFGLLRQPGHRFFFSLQEVEALP